MAEHWLALEFRIQYKQPVLAFRHFESTHPPHLSSVLHIYQPRRVPCSSSEKLLKIPRVNRKSASERLFNFTAPLFGTRFQTAFAPSLITCN